MHLSVFAEFSLIIAIAAGISLVMRLLKQPMIIGYILTGILVGPTLLHLVSSPETIDVFSSIGIALLLFIIGLGLNPRVIKEVGKVAAIAGLAQVFISIFIGWGAGLILGFSQTEAVFLGVALAFSSTIIILKLLSDKKEQNRLYGKIATGILLIQDLLALIALLFATAHSTASGFSLLQLTKTFGFGLLIAVPVFLIGSHVLPRMHRLLAGSSEFLFLFAVGWGFGIAALFEASGLGLEIGALIAGVSLASLPYTQEISARLRPLRDFFIIVFFIALGTRLSFDNLAVILPAIIMCSFIVVVIKPVIVLFIMGTLGYTKKTSFKAAVSLGQLSEFSLVFVIIGNKAGLVSDTLVSVITLVALISIAISSYLIIYSDKLYDTVERHLVLFGRTKNVEHERRENYELILFGYHKGGHEFLKVFETLKKRYVVVDYDPDVIDQLEQQKINYIYGDATDMELFEELGLEHAKLVVSTITDHPTNTSLMKLLDHINPQAVVILTADNVEQASELYELGASYVVIPHYIGSEKISAFIRRSGLKKSEFRKYREKHLAYIQTHYAMLASGGDTSAASASAEASSGT